MSQTFYRGNWLRYYSSLYSAHYSKIFHKSSIILPSQAKLGYLIASLEPASKACALQNTAFWSHSFTYIYGLLVFLESGSSASGRRLRLRKEIRVWPEEGLLDPSLNEFIGAVWTVGPCPQIKYYAVLPLRWRRKITRPLAMAIRSINP